MGINVELPSWVAEEIIVETLKEQYDMHCKDLEQRHDDTIKHGGVFYSNREKDIVAIKEHLKALKKVLWSNMTQPVFDDYFEIQGAWENYYLDDEKEVNNGS